MERTRSPHFLRVVQALAFVSGVGPVAIVAGSLLLGCGSSSVAPGVAPCPDACGGGDSSVPSDGSVTDAGAYDGHVIGVIPFPTDASHEGGLVGGPLLAPELPA